ncbi:6-phosphofructokinase [Allomyces macrogynus ATCC 38327]|uniref:ATP-dependent 6-phosphofructokinase n=1 Tax=Allomyces macrogynus (strain ATCC 38327) TaxID=578462 RepID=A0A0L0SPK3_ALLM3|nr:6-phosphofructokinase [Allomyces macrogynus ATCC 38327]|eukprot:KNE64305.1 6-phosphofructokinase [Allomyces macrogynus ATCC 38327]
MSTVPLEIPSLSHVTLRAPDAATLGDAKAFYTALGFQVVREEQGGIWLVYFTDPATSTPAPPRAAAADAATRREVATPAVLHLRVADPDAPVPRVPAPDRLQSAPVSLCFTVRSLRPLEHLVAAHNLRSDAAVRADGASYLYVADPLGNVVVFTNRAHPLAHRVLESASTPSSAGSPAPSFVIPWQPSVPVPYGAHDRSLLQQRLAATASPVLPPDVHIQQDVTGPELTLPVPAIATRKRRIGILTSGGDSQGMNAAVRAVVRMAHVKGLDPWAIYDGYQGLVDNVMRPLAWADVQGLLRLGGTVIGTARCLAFRERAGRLTAAQHLVENGIDALVVIGGDGSLTGADRLRAEWGSLLDELLATNRIDQVQRATYAHLNIVGLVGSIDNDMSSTDMTIGCVSALHRICEAVDAIEATALSHGRAFVVEVMGRHCGWLALTAALASAADWLFVPERPPLVDNWEEEMCAHLKKLKDRGQKKILVIVSEGAIDKNLKPIKSEYVRDLLAAKLKFDARVTTLGHVQRGGSPCFYDRYLGTVQGVRAVDEILRATPETPSPMIGISNNKITVEPLVQAVTLTHAVSTAIDAKDFARAMELRDPEFATSFDTFVAMNNLPVSVTGGQGLGVARVPRTLAASPTQNPRDVPTPAVPESGTGLRIGILHIGAPAGGSNAATRAAALLALNRGHTPLAIYNGVEGLVRGDWKPLTRRIVQNWTARGGSELGTNREQPGAQLGLCAYQLQRAGIQALLFVGGFEAFTAMHALATARKEYPALCIPMAHIPATISNNVPGTEHSLGSDTALNAIVDACDKIKQSASASRKRVFVMEVHGGNVGYLATLGGLAGGSTAVYIPEEGVGLHRVQRDVDHLIRRYSAEGAATKEGRILLRNEAVSSTYTTDVLCSILRAEARGLFDARSAVLGHLQQGGAPSPLDRVRATRLAAMCVDWIENQAAQAMAEADGKPALVYTMSKQSACVIGIQGATTVFTPVEDLMIDDTDLKKRRAQTAWWMEWRGLIPLLSGYTIDPDAMIPSPTGVAPPPPRGSDPPSPTKSDG